MAPCPHEGPNEDRHGGAPIRGPLGFPRHAGVSRPYRLPITGALEGVTLRSLQGRQGGQPARYIQATLQVSVSRQLPSGGSCTKHVRDHPIVA